MPVVLSVRGAGRRGAAGGSSGPPARLVVLDDGRVFRVSADELTRHGVVPGAAIPDDVAADLAARGSYDRAREFAVRCLAMRARTASELRLKLKERGVPDAEARAVLDDLSRVGYLDDLAFARAWVADRLARRPCGAARLRRDLREKGVENALVEQAIREAYGEEDPSVAEERAARSVLAGRLRRWRHLPPDVSARRLAGVLQRRGFSAETIGRVLRAIRRGGAPEAADD